MDQVATAAIDHVLKLEGGLVDHPEDPGGITKFGISLRAYPHLGHDGIRNLTKEEARRIYFRDYWTPIATRTWDHRLRFMAFDAAVNHGLTRASRWLDEHRTLEEFTAHRLRFYARLQTFTTFGKGWMNRMGSVIEAISRLPNPLLPVRSLFVHYPDGRIDRVELDIDRPARVEGWKLLVNAAK